MNRKLKVLRIEYDRQEMSSRDAAKLRGFFAVRHQDNPLFHNHLDNKFVYSYPQIQYKVIDKKPMLIGFGDGFKPLYNGVMEEENITVGERKMDTSNLNIKIYETEIGDTTDFVKYRFLNPWLSLNQKNYEEYMGANNEERKVLLRKVLTGNVLSLAKSLDLTIENTLVPEVNLKEITVNFKNNQMIAFVGDFRINFLLPDYLGIGRSVSRGFGAVKRVK